MHSQKSWIYKQCLSKYRWLGETVSSQSTLNADVAFQSTCEHWRLSGCLFGHPLFMCRHGRGLCHLRLQGQPWWAAAGLGQALQALGLPANIGPPLCLLQRGDQLKSPSVQGSAGIALQHGLGVGCGIMARRGPATVCLWGWGPWGLMVVPITTLITRFPSPCLSHTLHAGRELFWVPCF